MEVSTNFGKEIPSRNLREKGSVFRAVKTVLLANGHFAWVTPAIFVDFQFLKEKNPLFLWGRMQYHHFRQFSSKPLVFGRTK